ncbi:hypothetical protein CAEBREN_00599 [Caenorhabditis brenneri]|uniref:Uncharacterized protein n=1 Tax=Caenorhabditis brenneri TaxID=135651 RepID=G0N3D8_CAEBE|nr:hypothetical protein CAEBREN_00599 [Caenorhabditis brenneri]
MRPARRNKQRQQASNRGSPRDGSRDYDEALSSNKKTKSDYPFSSWDQKKKQLQSLRLPTVGIIALIIGALEFQIDSGTIDGLNTFLTGFLCTSTMIEWKTNSRGRRRKTNNSYFYIVLFIIRVLIGLMNFEILKSYYGEYNAQVTTFKLTMTVIGSFIGAEVITLIRSVFIGVSVALSKYNADRINRKGREIDGFCGAVFWLQLSFAYDWEEISREPERWWYFVVTKAFMYIGSVYGAYWGAYDLRRWVRVKKQNMWILITLCSVLCSVTGAVGGEFVWQLKRTVLFEKLV